MRKNFFLSLVLLFVLALVYSQISIAQEHPLAGKKYGSMIFMKNLTTDNQTDYSNDTCNFLETTKNIIPDIWVRAFLKNDLKYYIDYLKKKHEKIIKFFGSILYTIKPNYYENGKKYSPAITNTYNNTETIKLDDIPDYNVNTLLFKFSEFENFVKQFSSLTKDELSKNNRTCILKISCTLKIGCLYVNILEKERSEFYSENSRDIVAIKSEETDVSLYDYFTLLIK